MLNEAELRELYPKGRAEVLAAFAAQQDELFAEYEIAARPVRLAFFLAQVGHESEGLSRLEENLSYSPRRLMQVWPKRFPTLAATQGFARNPRALANRVYGGRMGNTGPDDGWHYRGRGLLQVTGRDGYAAVAMATGLDLMGEPELAAAPSHALRVACGVWRWKGLNRLSDSGDFEAVTRALNGGLVGIEDRYRWLESALDEISEGV